MLELTHIVDTNKAIVSPFAGQVKRCDEALLKIHDILEALKDAKLSYDEYDEEEINYV